MDEMINMFNRNNIRYLVFGGQAVRLEGMPRFTMDFDIFIPGRDVENMDRINKLLEDELDMPILPIGSKGKNLIQTYQTRWGVVQFHLSVAGVPGFDEAEKHAQVHVDENGIDIRCLSLDDLLASKKTASRPQDQSDIDFLEIKKRYSTSL